jgi:hypothetical protein
MARLNLIVAMAAAVLSLLALPSALAVASACENIAPNFSAM